MIRCYFGALGSGKSYGMTADAYSEFRRGRVVFSTCTCSFGIPVRIQDLEYLVYERFDQPALLLVDEAGLLWWARRWSSNDDSQVRTLITSRKRALDVWYTAQYFEQVDRVLRELTTERVLCYNLGRWWTRIYWQDSFLGAQIVCGRWDKNIFDLYDTFEFVSRRPRSSAFRDIVNYAIDESVRCAYQRRGSLADWRRRYGGIK